MLCDFHVLKIAICIVSFHSVADISAALKGFETVKDYRAIVKRKHQEAVNNKPPIEFENTDEEVVVRAGESASLPCSVKNLGDNVVSWIRRRDLQILTSDIITFTADKRIHVQSSEDNPNEWNLVINSIQNSDTGYYECQINTEPKLKKAVLLLVQSSHGVIDYSDDEGNLVIDTMAYQIANILGPLEHYVHVGSTVGFTCYIRTNDSSEFTFERNHFTNHRSLVKWLHNSDLLAIESSRGGISIQTEIYPNLIMSRLTVAAVTTKDAGIYTCKPIKGLAHNVTLIVIQNEQIGAMKPENYLQSKADTIEPELWIYTTIFLASLSRNFFLI